MSSSPDKRCSPDLPRRVLFLNDVSFQYGAGVAQARQVEALLSLGIEAGVLAWAPGNIELETVATRGIDTDLWLGIRAVDHLQGGRQLSDEAVVAGLVAEVAHFKPDVVIVGNLHAARWPFALLPALSALGCRVVTFLHDAYLYTGRCAYPGTCRLYLTGCTEACPTAGQYPALAPQLIPAAWQVRRSIFGGPHGIDVVANSQWSRRMFLTALPTAHGVDTVELGSDEMVFKPGDRASARAHLGLPTDKPIVLCAAVNFQEDRKGCRYLREIIGALQDSVTFAAFGHNAQEVPGLIGLGYHLRADQLALIYQAADLFLGTATEEAFGQTIMEAQLCGLPAVAFHTGGVVEIIRHGITGLLVRNADSAAAVEGIRTLLASPALLAEYSTLARQHAVSRFSLAAHAGRWRQYLSGQRRAGIGAHPAVLAYPVHEGEDLQSLDRHRPSWPCPTDLLTEEHGGIVALTADQPGPRHAAEILKLYEMGYQAGDVILELGRLGGRAAVAALRGARAHPRRTLDPLYFGLTSAPDQIDRTRTILAAEGLSEHCHLLDDSLGEFAARWDIRPTMAFVQGVPESTLAATLRILSDFLPAGTPVLLGDYLSLAKPAEIAVRLAAQEWSDSGHARFMGCFGCSALYVIVKSSP